METTFTMTKGIAKIIVETLIEDKNLGDVNVDLMVKSYLSIYKKTRGDHNAKNDNAKFLIAYYSHQYRNYKA